MASPPPPQPEPALPSCGVDATFCPLLDRLHAIAPDTLGLEQDGGTAPLHDDQIIALHAIMPAFAGYLQVAYVQHDHVVAPLVPGPGYPAQTYQARARIALGTPHSDFPGWRVGPPFGVDLIVAIASTAPLFSQPLPDSQSLEAYLAALQTAVEALRRRGGTVAATALPIDTRPLP
jgi:serine/threonine-protein kinase